MPAAVQTTTASSNAARVGSTTIDYCLHTKMKLGISALTEEACVMTPVVARTVDNLHTGSLGGPSCVGRVISHVIAAQPVALGQTLAV